MIHCRGLASPQGLIDLIDQKEDQEEEGEGGPKSFLARSRTKVPRGGEGGVQLQIV